MGFSRVVLLPEINSHQPYCLTVIHREMRQIRPAFVYKSKALQITCRFRHHMLHVIPCMHNVCVCDCLGACMCVCVCVDLSKAFDTINHELLIAKLEAYGFEESALLTIQSYLTAVSYTHLTLPTKA